MRRRVRRAVIFILVLPVVLGVVLAAEVLRARMGPDLPDQRRLELDGRLGPAGGTPLRMVWLGDSTAAGVGASEADKAVPRLVAAALDRPVELTSLAVSGARVNRVATAQASELERLRPDVVLVSVGANDTTHVTSRADFRADYEDLVAAVPDEALLVLLGVPDMGSAPLLLEPLSSLSALRGRQLDEIVRDIAADTGAVYVDIAGTTGPPMRKDTGRYFAVDLYHPNDAGYELWAEAVLDELRPALSQHATEVG